MRVLEREKAVKETYMEFCCNRAQIAFNDGVFYRFQTEEWEIAISTSHSSRNIYYITFCPFCGKEVGK